MRGLPWSTLAVKKLSIGANKVTLFSPPYPLNVSVFDREDVGYKLATKKIFGY